MSVKEYEKQLNDGYRRIESDDMIDSRSKVTDNSSIIPSVHSVLLHGDPNELKHLGNAIDTL